MKSIVFWDPLKNASRIEDFREDDRPLHLVASLAGLERYRKESPPGELAFWIENEKDFDRLLPEINLAAAPCFFPYDGLRPSEIIRRGSFQGPRSMELPDFRIQDLSLLRPAVEVLQRPTINDPAFSVVIPVFDNQIRAAKALESWLQQSEPDHEIYLIDDGSGDDWVASLKGRAPERLGLLRLPRTRRRSRGDGHFRAGLARNIGVDHSRGKNLVFCDSDIVVPPDFLRRIARALESSDLVMPMRWQLSPAASEKYRHYDDLRFERDVLLSPGAYWEQFQMRENSWMDLEHPWKWTSSFCLALSRRNFDEVGPFKKSFVHYGFEDTEFGFRLFQAGKKFDLLPVNTYHLHQPDSHSEYANKAVEKERLLGISAERFFRHHPRKEVYAALRRWLD